MILNKAYPPTRKPANQGFTLIELLVVISIIGVLVGLILPGLQGGREAANKNHALSDVSQIVMAEIKTGKFTPDLAELANLQLIDPTLGTGSKDGYRFAAIRSADGGFVVTAVPAAPGITGALDIVADQTGAVTGTPSKGAAEARAAMFAAIDREAVGAIEKLLAEAPEKTLRAAIRFIREGRAQSREALTSSFKRLDANGDSNVTLSEVVSYDKDTDSPLGAFLVSLHRTMQLGAANEDVQSLPGVGLTDLLCNRK